MPYSEKTKAIIANAPKTLGTDLARWAMLRDISVKRIAMATGATRQTVLQLVYRLNRSHLSVQRSRYDDHRHIKKGEPNRRRMENAMYSIQPTQLTDEEFF
jgi:hypothetical protein